MRATTMRRRTGCLATSSVSEVVKPTPVRAERAWKRTASLRDDLVDDLYDSLPSEFNRRDGEAVA